MKITNKQIKQMIKEEISKVVNENIGRQGMLKLITLMLSGSNGIKQAIELGKSLGVFYNYQFYDTSSEVPMHKIESYEHNFETTPEFIKLAAEELGHDLEKTHGYFEHSFTDADFGYKFTFHLGKYYLSDKQFTEVRLILARTL